MANADVYTQWDRWWHRMCGVWSPLISDRLDGYCRPPLVSLFFYGAICLPCVASPRSFVSLQSADLLRFDGSSQNTWIRFSQTTNSPRFRILKFQRRKKQLFIARNCENTSYMRFSFDILKFPNYSRIRDHSNIYNRLINNYVHIFVEK